MDVTKWEYKLLRDVFPNPDIAKLSETLNALGQEGWEAFPLGDTSCFKRPCGRIHVEEVEVNQDQSKLIYPDK